MVTQSTHISTRPIRSNKSHVFGIEAELFTTGHRFGWNKAQTAIFERFVNEGRVANSFNIAQLMVSLNLDGYEDVVNSLDQNVHDIILAKVMRKISNTRKKLRVDQLIDHERRYPSRPATPVEGPAELHVFPITSNPGQTTTKAPRLDTNRTTKQEDSTQRPKERQNPRKASREDPVYYNGNANIYSPNIYTVHIPRQPAANFGNVPQAPAAQRVDPLVAEKLAAQRDYLYNWASDVMDDRNKLMMATLIGRQDAQQLIRLLTRLQDAISDLDYIL